SSAESAADGQRASQLSSQPGWETRSERRRRKGCKSRHAFSKTRKKKKEAESLNADAIQSRRSR
ncbi:hypothetical protein IscW_ISCW015714, partial [Ixodes scapularis]